MALKRKGLIISDKEFKNEQKRYEKVQRAIEKKDFKKLGKWLGNFGKGKDNWLY